jgi:hypothetical protein
MEHFYHFYRWKNQVIKEQKNKEDFIRLNLYWKTQPKSLKEVNKKLY